MRIVPVQSAQELADAHRLFREYADSLPFSLCFQGFEQELATLPGRYAGPTGRLFVAYDDAGVAVGCIALRDIAMQAGPRTCEMKRLYVSPSQRGTGLGRKLCGVLIAEARAAGYRRMKLDTSADMYAAIRLYRSLGFTECARYNDDPMDDTLWFELRLNPDDE
jgi:ribosomal protein S18 acetylase RimI-like enzyme